VNIIQISRKCIIEKICVIKKMIVMELMQGYFVLSIK